MAEEACVGQGLLPKPQPKTPLRIVAYSKSKGPDALQNPKVVSDSKSKGPGAVQKSGVVSDSKSNRRGALQAGAKRQKLRVKRIRDESLRIRREKPRAERIKLIRNKKGKWVSAAVSQNSKRRYPGSPIALWNRCFLKAKVHHIGSDAPKTMALCKKGTWLYEKTRFLYETSDFEFRWWSLYMKVCGPTDPKLKC